MFDGPKTLSREDPPVESERKALRYWSEKLGCTIEELRSALQDTGASSPSALEHAEGAGKTA
jgi:Protein of unknown function (DUF3606)